MLKPLSELKPENAIRKPIIPTKATFRELVESPKVFCLGQGRPYTSEKRGAPDYSPLTDEQCLLAVPTVFGFGLDTKKWCKWNRFN